MILLSLLEYEEVSRIIYREEECKKNKKSIIKIIIVIIISSGILTGEIMRVVERRG